MIEVDRASWHASVYLWWYYAKWPDKRWNSVKVVGNLCPYVRTVLLWAPCRWLFYQGTVRRIRIAFIVWPALLLSIPQPLGYLSFMAKRVVWILDVFLAGALVVLGLGYAIGLVVKWADRRWNIGERWMDASMERRRRRVHAFERHVMVKETPKGPSFFNLVGQRISAAHDRVCPEIIFKSSKEM